MELYIAGGVGEHGRNCFLVRGETVAFLVDCGKMADMPEDPFPRLTPRQIRQLDTVFLTHSHADHTGALPWLYENGFRGTVVATWQTLVQLPFVVPNGLRLEELCPGGSGKYAGMEIAWGRSGHCLGSVWYRFETEGKTVFFSGDYTECTQVYACDPIRDQRADMAVLDCAYGMDETSYNAACERLVRQTKGLLSGERLLLFPVPKYGRGLELLNLFSNQLLNTAYYADALFLENLAEQRAGGFWYCRENAEAAVQPYTGQTSGIVFVSDPQLRGAAAQKTAEQVLTLGGKAVMTGTVEKGSYSERLLERGDMVLLRYPVHLNAFQYRHLLEENNFSKAIPYHSEAFTVLERNFSF